MLFTKAEYLGTATLIGTIIGAGIFGLPYVASQVGFLPTVAYLAVLGGVICFMHLMYGEIVLRTRAHHFLAGYAEKYLGPGAKRLTLLFVVFGLFGTLLAYAIIGGQFISLVVRGWLPDAPFLYGLVFGVAGILLVLKRIKFLAEIELGVVLAMLAATIGIVAIAAPVIDPANFTASPPFNLFLPYGIILFAVAGFEAIPEMREIFEASRGRVHSSFPKAVITGTFLPLIIFTLFIAAVYGVTGHATSEDALTGLTQSPIAFSVIKLAAFFGLLAITSSFLVMADNLKKVLWYDLNFPPFLSWALVLIGTILLYFLSGQAFIAIIALVGAVSGGFNGIMMVLVHRRAQRFGDRAAPYRLHVPAAARVALIAMYVVGGAYQLWVIIHGHL